LHSLRSKFIVLAVLLICITQFGTLITTSIMAESDAVRQAQANLSIGGALFNELMRGRTKARNKLVTTLADTISSHTDPMLSDDYKPWLSGKSTSIGADFSLLLNNDGAVITTSTNTVSGPYPTLVSLANQEGASRSMITMGDQVFEMVTVSITNMRPKMWLSSGFKVNSPLINMLQERTGLDATIIARINNQRQVLASSIDNHALNIRNIDPLITNLDVAAAMTTEIGGERFLVQSHSFLPNTHDIVLLLKAPLNQAIAPYHVLQLLALAIGVLACIIALIGATQLFRGIRAPLERIQAAAHRISTGDYSVPVNTRSNEEFSELAVAINDMQSQVAARESRVLHATRFDQLTGLQNRSLTVKSLKQSIEKLRSKDSAISVLLISLPGFRDIRASFGQEIGDQMLLCTAEKLHSTAPPDTVLARLEGDEFLLTMEATDATSAMVIAENIVSMLAAGLSSDTMNISAFACIGISTFPQDGNTAEKLLLHATIANREAPQKSGQVATYQTGMEEQYSRRLEILGSLCRAIREDELKLYLQPKVNLVDGSICGAEALIRWDHPALGFLSPLEFIPIAEQSGNIGLISEWLLSTAIRECKLWLEAGFDLPVSVNLSGHDLFNTNLPQMIAEILREHDLAPNYLMLEITEPELFHDFDLATAILQNLHNLGIKISVDNFGAGHSSMAHLRNLPIDELKIDRSFVTELPNNSKDVAIVRATIKLAHNLGIEVLAAGIESHEAMNRLAEMGCERAQSFLISRPMPAETFSLWVSHYSEDRSAYINVLKMINR